MGPYLNDETRKEVVARFQTLKAPVRVIFFSQRQPCASCREQEALLRELAGISDKIRLEVHDLVADSALANQYGISKVPATAVIGERDYGIRFFGVTAGYEFASLLEAIHTLSTAESGLTPEEEAMAQRIDVPVHLEVMVTLTCPYCPRMVRLAHQLAFVNAHIRADMVDSAEFPPLAQRYQVTGVPKTVINETTSFEGAVPPLTAIMEILRAVKPAEYARVEEALREAEGVRKVRPAKAGETYDVAVVGAGPAAITAALYAARKMMSVAVLGEQWGGQVAFTASVENWPGIPTISGQELIAILREHVERYVIAEGMGLLVEQVEKDGAMFRLSTDQGTYSAKTVIYCAGKHYRTLDIPGESRFLGHGIAFCATCDAPLYQGRQVAVVGGGNSAFTALRDLLPYAREAHLVHKLEQFQADPVLVESVRDNPKAVIHTGMEVREFLGQDHLTGLRLQSADGRRHLDLLVDGVFLEIGLIPNSDPVKDLLPLNPQGEIPVRSDQSTSIPGFFAAGDVTDVPDKQIVIAAGQGAQAALSAYRYLISSGAVVNAIPEG